MTSIYFFRETPCSNRHLRHMSTRHSTHLLPTSTCYGTNRRLTDEQKKYPVLIIYRASGACRPSSSNTFVSKPIGFLTCHISLMSFPTRCVRTKSATKTSARARSLRTRSESVGCLGYIVIYTHSQQWHRRKRRRHSAALLDQAMESRDIEQSTLRREIIRIDLHHIE